ncbi:MAG: lipid-A-disaccharide synthase [Candidatus Hydrothermota bacterium]|nr:MAG: lipid-A-disaccharide synthase [Candidatus Hydrothermae bacterium]
MGLKIFISAGEYSGDLHASNLVKALRSFVPDAEFFGMGGRLMAKAGVELLHSFEEESVVGFLEAALRFRKMHQLLIRLARAARKADIAIFVDYPGFHLQLAAAVHRMGVKTAYYIVPQVWAWGGWRVRILKRHIDKAIVILPFEEPLLRSWGIDAEFVGHPIIDVVDADDDTIERPKGIEWTIGLLPGSRKDEIRRLLPRMLKIKELIQKELGDRVHFFVSLLGECKWKHLLRGDPTVSVFNGRARAIIKASDLVILASGTASLEAALLKTPMIVIYMLSDISWIMAKTLAKVRSVSLVNLLMRQSVVPEFVQHVHPDEIASVALNLLHDKTLRNKMISKLAEIRSILGERGASVRAAKGILSLIR